MQLVLIFRNEISINCLSVVGSVVGYRHFLTFHRMNTHKLFSIVKTFIFPYENLLC